MTFNSVKNVLLIVLLTAQATASWASLGDGEGAIVGDRMRMRALHSVTRGPQYSVHELKAADGSRVREYVTPNGIVFAVSWKTLYKPDFADILGSRYPAFADSLMQAARRGGIQRQFRHQGADLIVLSTGHLNVYAGYAYSQSLLPSGLDPRSLGLG